MKKFGLIGYPLTHSFSKKYFAEKFQKEGISDCEYELYELATIDMFPELINDLSDELIGLNVTIPHKEVVIPFLDEIDPAAKAIGAVNVIKRLENGKLKGFNSDYYGFKNSLEEFLGTAKDVKALVLGTGGASKAVKKALEDIGLEYVVVSRNKGESTIDYSQVLEYIDEYKLIINSTPLGTYPQVDSCPDLPYNKIGEGYFLYDLVYNPELTQFMERGMKNGAKAVNGLQMLVGQAEKAWEIWNEK